MVTPTWADIGLDMSRTAFVQLMHTVDGELGMQLHLWHAAWARSAQPVELVSGATSKNCPWQLVTVRWFEWAPAPRQQLHGMPMAMQQ